MEHQEVSSNRGDVLRAFGARRGHFAYESGYHGDLFLNLDRVIGQPSALKSSMDELTRQISALSPPVDLICGPLSGGAFVAFALATNLGLRFCWSARNAANPDRKLYPFGYHIEGDLEGLEGKRVVIVDDAISAGSAVRGTLQDLRHRGMKVIGVAALLTVGSGAADLCQEEKLHLLSLASSEDRFWTPEECPMCREGNVPLVDVG